MLGWDQYGSDFYIWVDPAVCDLEHAVSAVAYYQITGPASSIVPDLVLFRNKKRFHVNVPQAALPNGTEVNFHIDVTMDDASVVRVPPGTDNMSVIVYR